MSGNNDYPIGEFRSVFDGTEPFTTDVVGAILGAG